MESNRVEPRSKPMPKVQSPIDSTPNADSKPSPSLFTFASSFSFHLPYPPESLQRIDAQNFQSHYSQCRGERERRRRGGGRGLSTTLLFCFVVSITNQLTLDSISNSILGIQREANGFHGWKRRRKKEKQHHHTTVDGLVSFLKCSFMFVNGDVSAQQPTYFEPPVNHS